MTSNELNSLWREKKRKDPQTFDQAYISPSTQNNLLSRLVAEHALLIRDRNTYHLTPKGSKLADLIDVLGVDTCSSKFISEYKGMIAHAALLVAPQHRLTAKEVAAETLLSADSARHGLNDLVLWGRATFDQGAYALIPEASKSPPSPHPLEGVKENPEVDEGEEAPDPLVYNKYEKEVEDLKALKYQRYRPMEEYEEEDDERDVGCEGCLSAEWQSVSQGVQDRFIARAAAVRLSLADYMAILDESYVEAAQRALLPPGQFICRDCACGGDGEPNED